MLRSIVGRPFNSSLTTFADMSSCKIKSTSCMRHRERHVITEMKGLSPRLHQQVEFPSSPSPSPRFVIVFISLLCKRLVSRKRPQFLRLRK